MAKNTFHARFSSHWRRPPSFLGPTGRAEYRKIISSLARMRGLRPRVIREHVIAQCLRIEAGDEEAAVEMMMGIAAHYPVTGLARLAIDNTQPHEQK